MEEEKKIIETRFEGNTVYDKWNDGSITMRERSWDGEGRGRLSDFEVVQESTPA